MHINFICDRKDYNHLSTSRETSQTKKHLYLLIINDKNIFIHTCMLKIYYYIYNIINIKRNFMYATISCYQKWLNENKQENVHSIHWSRQALRSWLDANKSVQPLAPQSRSCGTWAKDERPALVHPYFLKVFCCYYKKIKQHALESANCCTTQFLKKFYSWAPWNKNHSFPTLSWIDRPIVKTG